MTINEIEASSVSNLIDAFIACQKGGSLVDFISACKKTELIDENGKFNMADLKYLKKFNKKLKELITKAEQINSVVIGDMCYVLGEKIKLDASNLKLGEEYVEHTQINPNRYEVFKKDLDTETIENSWKILNKFLTK